MTSRLAEVAPERLAGWVQRFAASHGDVTVNASVEALDLVAPDGTRARVDVPWGPADLGGGDPVAALAAHAALPRTALLLLVRRGGWAVGLARGGALTEHRTGTRYVQGRTAAGGWSQQRFARRRSEQAASLAGAAADGCVELLGRAARAPEVVVVGGDRQLVADVLADPRLARAAGLPRSPLLDVPDPRVAVLRTTAERARAVRVRVTDAL